MEIPFTIECLDELAIGESAAETVIIYAGTSHRYSEITVYEQGSLNIYSDPTTNQPATIEVTGDVTIDGQIFAAGHPGFGGHDGWVDFWNSYGGEGGNGGYPYAGKGGYGGKWQWQGVGWILDGMDGTGAAHGGAYGRGGDDWERGSSLSLFTNVLGFLVAGLTGDVVGVITDFYGAAAEGVKISENHDNAIKAAGWGGLPSLMFGEQERELASFVYPQSGGGGGGGGFITVSGFEEDYSAGGGGGGGGGGSSLKLVAGGEVLITETGRIYGRGGNGGRGGDAEDQEAAPGGGGGGGNGAQILIIADNVRNNGLITTQGGTGGLSGEVISDSGDIVLINTGIGHNGHDGILRVDGRFAGNDPERTKFYLGPRPYRSFKRSAYLWTESSSWVGEIFLGDTSWFNDLSDPSSAYYYFHTTTSSNGTVLSER